MMNQPQIDRVLTKLDALLGELEPRMFIPHDIVAMNKYETDIRYDALPADAVLTPAVKGEAWGKELGYCWFDGTYTVPEKLAGKNLFVMPHFGSYETMLFVDDVPYGTFANKITNAGHGNHYCDLIRMDAKAGEQIHLTFEAYAGHYVIGCYPFETSPNKNFTYTYEDVTICTKDDQIIDFYFDLRTLLQLARAADPKGVRYAQVINTLLKVNTIVQYAPEDTEPSLFRECLNEASVCLKQCLMQRGSASSGFCGLIGHSHLDTAWLWTIPETVKKATRTAANALSLMEQYPEYKFVMSSSYHLEVIRRHYPKLFERIAARIKEGRYEPNGGVWVECDCNITGGEAMIRQFLWGQHYTRKHFGYTSNSFWLPDTFGYSAALPQIMQSCDVDYFLTTKLSWNDTNVFPYETFWWEGIDGSKVFTHFNCTHCWPDVKEVIKNHYDGLDTNNFLHQKNVSDKRLVSYGYGDGGGGPQFEMVEASRRVADLDGVPKTEHMLVADFMDDLKATAVNPNTYAGELYLELHRGTLTNQHKIKYNNRKAEIELRNLEVLSVANAVKEDRIADDAPLHEQYEVLLVNQFHDILPGTCIAAAHDQNHEEMDKLRADVADMTAAALANEQEGYSLVNLQSFDYNDIIELSVEDKSIAADVPQQQIVNIKGETKLVAAGITVPAMSSKQIALCDGAPSGSSAFTYDGEKLETPFASVIFNEKGYISSFIDKSNGRQLVKEGSAFGALLYGQDVPQSWDNWDIEVDLNERLTDCGVLTSRSLVADGPVEIRIRSTYRFEETTVRQDIIFYAHTPRVDFETEMDWNSKRRFLKADFDTTLHSRYARHEIQFGNVERPTTRNTSVEQAMFEVTNHKYTDLSETGYGISILNDCKYGISVEGGDMRLSLHKGGIRPDPRGDKGVHYATYSLLPHNGAFCAKDTILPAYMLNNPVLAAKGAYEMVNLGTTDKANIIVEAIKPLEDSIEAGEKAYILRVYEAEGCYTNATLNFGFTPKAVAVTNMLEEVKSELEAAQSLNLTFNPFEIKTLKISY